MTARDRWALPAITREAVRNVRTSRRRLQPLLYFATIAGVAMAILAAVEGVQLRSDLTALALNGRNVVVLGSVSEVPTLIDRGSCESLAAMPGVDRAGAVLTSQRLAVLPVGSIPVVPVSVTLVPELRTAPAVIGSAVTAPPSVTRISIDGIPIAATHATAQPEGIPLNQAIAVAAPPTVDTIERCIAVLSTGADAGTMIPILAAQLVVNGTAPTGVTILDEPLDRIDTFHQRLTRWIPLLVGILGGLATAAIAATRSNEFASYRISGTSRRSLFLIYGLEASLLAGTMATSGALAAIAVSAWVVDVGAIALSTLAAAAGWVLIALLGFLPLSTQSILTSTKER